MDWYQKNIEEPLRGLVRHLRENGINTECSCGHEMYIQCQFWIDGFVQNLHKLLYGYLFERGLILEYEIEIHVFVEAGHVRHTLEVKLPKLNKLFNQSSQGASP